MNKERNHQSSNKTKAPNLQFNTVNGHRGREITATGSAPPNVTIVNQSSKALTAAHQSTAGVGNTSNDALNHDAIRTTASVLRNDTHSIAGTEYKVLEAPDVRTNETGGFFRNAHNTILNNPLMVDNSTNIVMQGAGVKRKAKTLLSEHMIPGASHDSSVRDPPPQCHPGTRIKINDRIIAWFYDKIKQELILWISGPAGVGKSAIVQTFAEKLASAGCLGASVFFSRPNGRDKSHAVFITIAYQLAVHIEPYCAFISDLLDFDPEIVNKSMEEQFKAFIVKPFAEKNIGAGGKTWGVLLDGLDELDKRDRQGKIIQLITAFAHDHPEVPLAWVISSRPEPHITNTFEHQRPMYSFKEEYVPINSPEACQDVERFLRSRFKTIQQVEFPHIVTKGWPKERKVEKLANAASGLFAFADVAIRFIGDRDYADPTSRLDEVVSGVDGCRAASTDDQPFASLDALYTLILTRIPSKMWPTTQRVVGAIVASILDLDINCVKGLSVVLGLPLSKVYASINDLYSLLDIPPLVEVYERQFRFHHASFVDFLRDPARSKKFHTSKENAVIDVNESFIRIWLDFKRNSVPGPSSGYKDRWYEYASQFHSESHQPTNELTGFNILLSIQIHNCVFKSLQDRWSIVQREGPKHHWGKFIESLCQIDAGTAYHGVWSQKSFVNLWFDIWKAHREELRSRGVAREIQLQDLSLDSLETEKGELAIRIIKVHVFESDTTFETHAEHAGNYKSYFKHFQTCYPKLPVLICGLPGSLYGVFKFKIIEDDCTNMPLDCIAKRIRISIIDHDPTSMYHIFPCSDDA